MQVLENKKNPRRILSAGFRLFFFLGGNGGSCADKVHLVHVGLDNVRHNVLRLL